MAERVGAEADADLWRDGDISLCYQTLDIRALVGDQGLHVEVLVEVVGPDVPASDQGGHNPE